MKDKLSDKIRSSKICGCHFTGNFFLIFTQFYRQITSVRNGLANNEFDLICPFQRCIPISAFYPHFSVLSPFQRFIPISAFYPHFSVLSPFQRFIPISVSAFSFRFRDSVSAFYPYPMKTSGNSRYGIKQIVNFKWTYFSPVDLFKKSALAKSGQSGKPNG